MNLIEELQAEQVSHLSLSDFCQVDSGMTVRATLAKMRENGCAVCLVMDDGRLSGIFTERDVLQKVAAAPETWAQPVDNVMTINPVTVLPTQSAALALRLMDEHHFRNLPVVDGDGRISGAMTHRAIIEFLASRYPIEIINQPPRINRFPRKAEGG